MLKKVLAAAALVLVASLAHAQGAARDGTLTLMYDVDSTNLTYCKIAGNDGTPYGPPITAQYRIKTVGVSTTVTEFTASTNPFTPVSVGDVLVVQTPTATSPNHTDLLVVTAKASGASITVDTAIDLSAAGGFIFGWYKQTCGTTADDGWAAVSTGAKSVALGVQYDQGDLTALVVRWECKMGGPGAAPVILYPGETADCGIGGTLSTDRCSFATPGTTARLTVVDTAPVFSFCRVGVAYTGADASDAGTNREKVTVTIAVR